MPADDEDFLVDTMPCLYPNQRAVVNFVRSANLERNSWMYIA